MTMRELTLWLTSLPLSAILRRSTWAIPAMQTAHLLALGTLLASIVMIDLRIWGYARSSTLVESARRFLPWDLGEPGVPDRYRRAFDHR